MDLIDRYIQELRTYLPRDLRDSVSAKVRTDFDRELQTRQTAEQDPTQQDLDAAILRELGPPHLVADAYVPSPRVLFGPRLYPPFFRTLKIAVVVLVALAALGVYLDFSSSQSLWSLGPALLSALGRLISGFLAVVGIAVLVFTMIERKTGAALDAAEEWDPRTLTDDEDLDKISLSDLVFGIAFLVVALIVVNFFRQRIGAHVTWNEESGWVPLLGPAFDRQLWLLNLALALDLLVNFTVLARWRWTWPLRIANFAVNCLYVVWLGLLTSQPPLIAADSAWMVQNGWSPAAAAEYEQFIASSFARHIERNLELGLWVACIALAYSLFKLIRRWLARPS